MGLSFFLLSARLKPSKSSDSPRDKSVRLLMMIIIIKSRLHFSFFSRRKKKIIRIVTVRIKLLRARIKYSFKLNGFVKLIT